MDEESKSSRDLPVLDYGEPPDPQELPPRVELLAVSFFTIGVIGVFLTLLARWLVCSTWRTSATVGFLVAIYVVLAMVSKAWTTEGQQIHGAGVRFGRRS